KGADERADWEILLRLAEELGGGPTGMRAFDLALRVAGWFGWRYDPRNQLDMLWRLGPHGDRYLPWRDGITFEKVQAAPHGIAVGRARAGIEHRLYHKDKRVHL